MEKTSRKQAISRNLKRYFTGRPCIYGHVAERFVSSSRCAECAKYAGKAYREKNKEKHLERCRNWRDANREKISKYNKAKYRKDKAQSAKNAREWRKRNPLSVIATKKKYYEKNKDKLREESREWKKKNPEKVRKIRESWNGKNPERLRELRRAARAARRARMANSEGRHSADDVRRIGDLQKWMCASCRKDLLKSGHHVDHIVAIINGGTNWPENIQLLCPTCNLSKNRKDPYEWAQENGRLL